MSDLKSKTNDKIDDVAAAAKATAGKAVDKAKDLAHTAGKKLEDTGKKLEDRGKKLEDKGKKLRKS